MNAATERVKRSFAAVFAIILAMGATGAQAATYDISWKGGSGGSEAEPKDLYSKDNWAAGTSYSGNSISAFPGSTHNFFFLVDSLTYLTNSNASAGTAICNEWNFTGGDCVLLGDIKSDYTVRIAQTAGNDASVVKPNGALTVGAHLVVGNYASGTLKVEKGSSVFVANTTYIGHSAGGTGFLELNGGSMSTKALTVGNGGSGTLTINSGTLETTDSSKNLNLCVGKNTTGTVNLNGGTLKTCRIFKNPSGASGKINFNGGTLMANAVPPSNAAGGLINSTTGVYVGAGGGVIDCGGLDIEVGATMSGAGSMLFTGGDGKKIKISGNVIYDGKTAVAPGTILDVANETIRNNILATTVVVAGVPTAGQTIMTYTSDMTDADLSKVTCPIAPNAVFAVRGEDRKSIVVETVGTLLPGWYIGPADGNLSAPANWSDGVVPTSGNATISCASHATLTVGDTFAPSSITFAPGSAPVTINGRDLTGIEAVTNLSFVSHTMNAKVYFAGDIQVSQPAKGNVDDLAKAHVTFAGGAYANEGFAIESSGTTQVYSRCVFGEYFLANDAAHPWTASQSAGTTRVALGENAVLHVPYGSNIGTIYVSTGAKVEAGAVTLSNSRVAYRNNGEIVIDSLKITGSADVCVTYGQGASPSVFKFASVTNSLSGTYRFRLHDANNDARHEFYIGKDGLNFSGTTGQYIIGRDTTTNYETIRPWNDDFTIAGKGDNIGIFLLGNIEFCTDDENGTGRTITMDAKTVVRPNTALTVSGSGTLTVNNTYYQDISGTLKAITLKDSATLEYATATASLGTGAITLGAGTTFAFKNANAGGALSLPSPIALPETGKATLRIDGAKLQLGEHEILASGATADSVNHLTVTGEALADRRVSLKVDGDKLILDIASKRMAIIIR